MQGWNYWLDKSLIWHTLEIFIVDLLIVWSESSPSFFFLMMRRPRKFTLFPYTTLFRSTHQLATERLRHLSAPAEEERPGRDPEQLRSEEHTPELQSPVHLVCRLLLE